MNDSFSRFVALLAVWVVALLPLLLLDRNVSRFATSLMVAHAPAEAARP
jgi:hypothetical protein